MRVSSSAQRSLQEEDAPTFTGSSQGPCVLSEVTKLSIGGLSWRECSYQKVVALGGQPWTCPGGPRSLPARGAFFGMSPGHGFVPSPGTPRFPEEHPWHGPSLLQQVVAVTTPAMTGPETRTVRPAPGPRWAVGWGSSLQGLPLASLSQPPPGVLGVGTLSAGVRGSEPSLHCPSGLATFCRPRSWCPGSRKQTGR